MTEDEIRKLNSTKEIRVRAYLENWGGASLGNAGKNHQEFKQWLNSLNGSYLIAGGTIYFEQDGDLVYFMLRYT